MVKDIDKAGHGRAAGGAARQHGNRGAALIFGKQPNCPASGN